MARLRRRNKGPRANANSASHSVFERSGLFEVPGTEQS
jgi:hypothetical protein